MNKNSRTLWVNLAKLTLAAFIVFGISTEASHREDLCRGFAPENDLKIPESAVAHRATFAGATAATAGGLDEAQYNTVLDRIEKLFTIDITNAGGNLIVKRWWTGKSADGRYDGDTVNASAERWGKDWLLNMFGGLARHPAITADGFAMVACHELGHHIGGAPKSTAPGGFKLWATNEGGADYYAALKCIKRYFAEDSDAINQQIIDDAKAAGTLDATVETACDQEYKTVTEQLFCKRSSLAAISTTTMLEDLANSKKPKTPVPPSKYTTPDTSVVKKMDDKHPAPQCRLDTYFAGMVCNESVSTDLSIKDYKVGSCVEGVPRSSGADLGYRPRCWFKP